MIILPYKKGLLKNVSYEKQIMEAFYPIFFFADNDWLRIYGECIVMFNHAKTHAVLNSSKSSYSWLSFNADMKKGFKFPKKRTIPIASKSLSGVW